MNRRSHSFGTVGRPHGGEGGVRGGGGEQGRICREGGGDEEMRKARRGNERLPFISTRSHCNSGRLQPGAGMA